MASTKITVNNNGSLRLEGNFEIVDKDGNIYDLGGRELVSVCRCGLSQNKPFCDGSHRGHFEHDAVAFSLPPKKNDLTFQLRLTMIESANERDMFDACRNGDMAGVERLFNINPALINVYDTKGFTPLIIAVYNNQPEVVDFLLQKGANADEQDLSGNTALMGVCFKGYKEVAAKLIAAGANVNQRNSQGAPALTFAATFGHLEIAEMLLKNGADITLADSRGKSPLNHAMIQENTPMVELLQKYISD